MELQKLEKSCLLAQETLFIEALNEGDSIVPGSLLSNSMLPIKTTKTASKKV